MDAEAAVDSGDWKSQLLPDARERIVNKIVDTVKKHRSNNDGPGGLQDLKINASRLEEKIFSAATNRTDYLRQISLKMLAIESHKLTVNSVPTDSFVRSSQNPQDSDVLDGKNIAKRARCDGAIFSNSNFSKMSPIVNLRSLMENNKLIGSNIQDWLRNLRIVLRSEKISFVLDKPMPDFPLDDADEEQVLNYNHYRDSDEIASSIMLSSMDHELQKQHENMNAHTMLLHLRELFQAPPRIERFELSKKLFRSKMLEGSSSVTHALKMKGYIDRLAYLGFVLDRDLSIDLILQSLPNSYSQFVLNYQTNNVTGSITHLINMLCRREYAIKREGI